MLKINNLKFKAYIDEGNDFGTGYPAYNLDIYPKQVGTWMRTLYEIDPILRYLIVYYMTQYETTAIFFDAIA